MLILVIFAPIHLRLPLMVRGGKEIFRFQPLTTSVAATYWRLLWGQMSGRLLFQFHTCETCREL